MAEPQDRYEREAEVKSALDLVWKAWTNALDIFAINAASLIDLLNKHVRGVMWKVWVSGYEPMAKPFFSSQADEENTKTAAAFLLFFRQWSNDLAVRWVARVQTWVTEALLPQETEAAAERPSQSPLQQVNRPADAKPRTPTQRESPSPNEGRQAAQGTQVTPSSPPGVPSNKPSTWADKYDQRQKAKDRWIKERDSIIQEHDLARESTNAVTGTNTKAEAAAAKIIESGGKGTLIPFWHTEEDGRVCKRCKHLNGQPPSFWVPFSIMWGGDSDGPPLHDNCRCWLDWRPMW